MARYHRQAATSIGNRSKVRLPMAWSWKNSSVVSGIADTSEVSFSIAVTSLPVGGTITRSAWGRVTRRRISPRPMPSAWAASVWPLSTDSSPARTISAM